MSCCTKNNFTCINSNDYVIIKMHKIFNIRRHYMNKLFKKIFSFTLVLTILLSGLSMLPASAAEDTYKHNFIEALLDNEDFWYENWGASVRYQSAITFMDLDFDGKLELIMQYGGGSMSNCEADAFYFDGNRIYKATSDQKTANKLGFENGLRGYYDTSTQKYVLLGDSFLRMSNMEGWIGNFVLNYNNHHITTDYYSSRSHYSITWGSEPTYTYYNGAKTYGNSSGYEKISEADYKKLNDNKLKNLVDVNMKRVFIQCSDWEKYSYNKKYEALEKAYDGFYYDKFTSAKIGDVDGDGNVSVLDATSVQMHVASISAINDDCLASADTDKDGNISILDATQIQLFVAKLITEF